MGSEDCDCNHPSGCQDVPAAAFIITRKDFIITPLQSSRKSCGCKRKNKIQDQIEPVDLFETFVVPPITKLNPFSSTNSQQQKPQSDPIYPNAMATSNPLRMPNLDLDDSIYTTEINGIVPNANNMNEPHLHTSTKHGAHQYYNAGSAQEVGYPQHDPRKLPNSYPNQQHPTQEIEQLMDTLRRFEYMPPNMPNLPYTSNVPQYQNFPSVQSFGRQNLNLNQRFSGSAVPYSGESDLRAEIRNLVRASEGEKKENRVWLVLVGLVHLLQALLTTAAVLVYYLVWCYTQMMYFIMKSMLFFHNADGSMKFAIALVIVTSVFFALSLVYKVERMFFAIF